MFWYLVDYLILAFILSVKFSHKKSTVFRCCPPGFVSVSNLPWIHKCWSSLGCYLLFILLTNLWALGLWPVFIFLWPEKFLYCYHTHFLCSWWYFIFSCWTILLGCLQHNQIRILWVVCLQSPCLLYCCNFFCEFFCIPWPYILLLHLSSPVKYSSVCIQGWKIFDLLNSNWFCCIITEWPCIEHMWYKIV